MPKKADHAPANAADAEAKKPSRREGITLTPFQWWQIDQLEGIYAATVPEVLKRAVLEWLQEHHDEIAQQKEDYAKFHRDSKS